MIASCYFRSWWLAILCSLSVGSLGAGAQVNDDDEPPEFLPGLVAHFELPSLGKIQRLDQDVLFDWSAIGLDLRTDKKSLIKANWTGFLESKESGLYKIHVFAAGQFTIRLDDKPILQSSSESSRWFDSAPIELKFGRHAIEIQYESTGPTRQLGLYWSGPQFELEPISHRYFSHRAENTVHDSFEWGAQLSRSLRCVACHTGNDSRKPLAAPALTHLKGNLSQDWLVERLTAAQAEGQRMPHFGLDRADAEAIAAALLAASESSNAPRKYEKPKETRRKKEEPIPRTDPSVDEGRTAFITLGCLACHQLNELGEQNLFDGGDLSLVAAKRSPDFFGRWLDDPASVNSNHRMPVFKLAELQRADLILFLQSLGKPASKDGEKPVQPGRDMLARGKNLLVSHRCAACHELPANLRSEVKRTVVVATSDWEKGCLTKSDSKSARPGFELSKSDREALRTFWTTVNSQAIATDDGKQLMKEQNCVACHARDASTGLASTLAKLATLEPDIAPQLAALGPPSLTGAGDKLLEKTLAAVVIGKDSPRRPWLSVQMPKFRLTDEEVESIVDAVIAHDRIPESKRVSPELSLSKAAELAAARLVTAEGFGCQSCHKIGSVEPPKVAINAHGTDLTMLGERVRPSWFRRWVHNPSRIVPRMEMPAIQVAAKGVLNDDLDLQLEALWRTLNTPGFEPPKPNPVRIVRNFNVEEREHANVLTDVLETPSGKYLRPLIIGLPNRHNVLFDLETGRLASWWIGDTARQYTRGKSWYWETGAPPLIDNLDFLQQFSIVDSTNRTWLLKTQEQFVVQFDELIHIPNGIEWKGRFEVQHESNSRLIHVTQRVTVVSESALEVETSLTNLNEGDQVSVETASQAAITSKAGAITADLRTFAIATWNSPAQLRIEDATHLRLEGGPASKSLKWSVRLSTTLPSDRLQPVNVPVVTAPAVKLSVVPGFEATQLPLPKNEMPTALAWSKSGDMVMASLKGRVFKVIDANADGLGDSLEAISDDLPAPYGLAVNENSVDVLCKTSLVRLTKSDLDIATLPYNQSVVADGWGYTADYHDWAVGLQRDSDGCYYMALPCQQDDRSEAAARLRGQALKLVPYQSPESPRAFRIEPISAGLRFPMGLALNTNGDLFATDNQGNYNPFNELNHLQFGKRYGFINKLEAKPDFSPDFESPAVNLPHPWTRSVNGLCFLNTPKELKAKGTENVFGAFEGDLIGCEYNGLSLIRMSLQKVGGQYQGAAYMFSRTPLEGEATFEGPVTCAVGPDGGLYVGSIHDSGWGGGQNTGSIVRLKADGELPLGIDEVRATKSGFEIIYTQPVDAARATQATNYNIRSYRRISTPAYGGDDQDERNESIRGLEIADDRKSLKLSLNELRAGYVYEINVGSVGNSEQSIFPSQAHYNMRAVPTE